MKKIIFTTCGTSLFTNFGRDAESRALILIKNHANSPDKPAGDDGSTLEKIIAEASKRLNDAKFEDAKKHCAEINGLAAICTNPEGMKKYEHYLIGTDTWLGQEAANAVVEYLKKHDCKASQSVKSEKLKTDSQKDFQEGLADLANKIANLSVLDDENVEKIFNLTGGFKSMLGFLQTMAMFSKNSRACYLFENGKELLTVPSLPVKFDNGLVAEHVRTFRRLELKIAKPEEIKKLPQSLQLLAYEYGGMADLSSYGRLIWGKLKDEIYKEKLLPEPSDRIKHGEKFEKSIADLNKGDLKQLNERIDQLACWLEKTGNPNPKSLDFKELAKPRPDRANWEFDYEANGAARRVFVRYVDDTATLIELGKHL